MRRSLLLIPFLVPALASAKTATLDGVTFAGSPNTVYVSLKRLGAAFDWKVGKGTLNGRRVPAQGVKALTDGSTLVPVRNLRSIGCIVNYDPKAKRYTVKKKAKPGEYVYVRKGQKRVFVNKRQQMLVAYQGQTVVMRSRVSTGRAGKQTPTGIFRAQAYKNPLHRSRLYDNVAMPYSVQIVGNIFIHGFRSVPGRAASSGCIRLPLSGGNPARFFYAWVEPGTPVAILGKWPKNAG